MNEGPPKVPVEPEKEKVEAKESMERPPRYRTIHREALGTGGGGGSLEKVVECNGLRHRTCVDEVVYGADGEIEFVDSKECVDSGPCDGGHK